MVHASLSTICGLHVKNTFLEFVDGDATTHRQFKARTRPTQLRETADVELDSDIEISTNSCMRRDYSYKFSSLELRPLTSVPFVPSASFLDPGNSALNTCEASMSSPVTVHLRIKNTFFDLEDGDLPLRAKTCPPKLQATAKVMHDNPGSDDVADNDDSHLMSSGSSPFESADFTVLSEGQVMPQTPSEFGFCFPRDSQSLLRAADISKVYEDPPQPTDVMTRNEQGRSSSDACPQDQCFPPSKGSALHASDQCKPCAWFWKPSKCNRFAECDYCHLCPEGVLEARVDDRKKQKRRQARGRRRAVTHT